MLRALFLLLSVLTDYRTIADALRSDFTFAMINTGVLLLLGSIQAIRRWRPSATVHPRSNQAA